MLCLLFIFQILDRMQHCLPVARFYVSGSYGRRVTVGSTEIDLVVFLRSPDRLPPYTKSNDDLLPRLHAYLVDNLSQNPEVTVLPLMSSGCFLGDSKRPRLCRKEKDITHRCCEQHVNVEVDDAKFRIFIAPALGKTSEEQRQATYRKMQEQYAKRGYAGLVGWHPSLIEKPSEVMAQAKPEIQAFIRICQFWIQLNRIYSMENYAVETLAYLVAKKMRLGLQRQQPISTNDYGISSSLQDQQHDLGQDFDAFDLLEAFKRFLSYCAELSSVRHLCEIESPATYISPFSNCSLDTPILTDNFNPYYNLLESVCLSISSRTQQKYSYER